LFVISWGYIISRLNDSFIYGMGILLPHSKRHPYHYHAEQGQLVSIKWKREENDSLTVCLKPSM
jgi:hypothetical protein